MSSYLLTQKQDIFQPFHDGELVITKIIIIAYSRLSVNKRERNSTRRNRRVSEKAGEVWDGSKSLTGVYMILRPDSDLSGFFFHSSASSMLLPYAAAFIKIFRDSSVAFI